jgi:hypothetical protein
MNLQDQVIYRCIHAACARQLPRQVNFCPWCGTGQHDGVVNPAHVARPAPVEYQAAYQEEPGEPGRAEVVVAPVVPAAVPDVAVSAAAAPEVVTPPAAPAPPPTSPPPPPAAAMPKQRAAVPAEPPRRAPVRLRWWLVALAALWLIWIYARPNTAKKIESRIENAMTASAECRLNDAQSELIALRMTRATPEQLARLQKSIDAAGATCGKKKQREKAWSDTTSAVEAALAEGDFAKAQARLGQFTKRWNEDDDTRKLKSRINERRAAAPPLAPLPLPEVVERSRPVQSVSARNLIDEADRALRAGNYRAAVDKLETCITMVDEGARECAAFKVHADRMLRERERCVAAGRVWVEDRCT